MAEFKVKIDITDIEPVKSLIDALETNIDNLPNDIYKALQALVDHQSRRVWDVKHFNKMSISASSVSVIVDGIETSGIHAIYPDELSYDSFVDGVPAVISFEHVKVINKETGALICEAGEKA
jgi:hypothetical protein